MGANPSKQLDLGSFSQSVSRPKSYRASSAPTLEIDSEINSYTIIGYIGLGTFGTIYKAKKNDELYAIKAIPSGKINDNTAESEKNFAVLIEVSASCENLVKCYEVFKELEVWYFVYEFCNGKDLEQYLMG